MKHYFSRRIWSNSLFIATLVASTILSASKLHAEDSSKVAKNSEQTLRVLCYNIHYGQGNDGVYDVARLAEVIKRTKPDLVALQEIDVHVERSGREHQIQMLGKLTGLQARFGPTQHYEGGLFGNGVLSRLPILDVLIQPLPYTESTPEKTTYPRAAIAVTVKLPDGTPLRFISTHFQHNMPEDRIAEAKAINRHFANPNDLTPTILAGDMNAKPEAEPILELNKKWINAINKEAAPTAPSGTPRNRIDYIFYRNAPNLKLKQTEVIPEKMASDHRPVFAIFDLKKP
ncbi:MAG: endonuclease/exonuclease/phosphatase family protein [Planctomycetaceae bacterium]|nr:endonuclease/exonuclease/phosphatase family protein [Planctomycetaceae bacterium]